MNIRYKEIVDYRTTRVVQEKTKLVPQSFYSLLILLNIGYCLGYIGILYVTSL
jgi:hypothetical protein